MSLYLIAELLPWEDVVKHPTGEFSVGCGFEGGDFAVVGPFTEKPYGEESAALAELVGHGRNVWWVETESMVQ